MSNPSERIERLERVGFNVEYRVRPITRWIVTRYEFKVNEHGQEDIRRGGVNSASGAEYSSYETAYAVGYALARAEHERLGYPLDDPRIQYPQQEDVEDSQKVG